MSTAGTDSLQAALGAEHAAVWGYGVVGGRLSGGARELAQLGYDQHRTRRDRLVALVTAGGGVPVAADAAYLLPGPVRTESDARGLAALLERRCQAYYADLVAAADPAARGLAARWLAESAVLATRWTGQVPRLPGLTTRS